jgi:proteasome lid subunit RPN8/RPN11
LSTSFELLLPRHVYEGAVAQAQAEHPNECCGFFAGKWEDHPGRRVARVLKRCPLVNESLHPQFEYFAERSLFPAVRDITHAGLDIVGIYHSHPTSDPVPSKKDREHNYYGSEVVHVILSLKSATPLLRAWQISESEVREVEWRLEEAACEP